MSFLPVPVYRGIPLNEETQVGFYEMAPQSLWKPEYMLYAPFCFCSLKNPLKLPRGKHGEKCQLKMLREHISCHAQESLDGKNDEGTTTARQSRQDEDR